MVSYEATIPVLYIAAAFVCMSLLNPSVPHSNWSSTDFEMTLYITSPHLHLILFICMSLYVPVCLSERVTYFTRKVESPNCRGVTGSGMSQSDGGNNGGDCDQRTNQYAD